MTESLGTPQASAIPAFWAYLAPANPFAELIVWTICILFCLWLLFIIQLGYRILRSGAEMNRAEDVKCLERFQIEPSSSWATSSELATTTDGPQDGREAAAKRVFEAFLADRRISADSVIARHIRTIYDAGVGESRLETDQLLLHTSHELFRGAQLLQSVLATFIILGLLGTLFGLADSLSSLSPLLTSDGQPGQIAGGLGTLLHKLQSAFAPSVCGVLMSVFGVLVYAGFAHFLIHPAQARLRFRTLTNWIPRLYPTVSQRMVETLRESQTEISKAHEAAGQLQSLLVAVDGEFASLRSSFEQANSGADTLATQLTRLQALTSLLHDGVAARLEGFSSQFTSDVNRLTSFQTDLRALYGQMVEQSGVFHTSVATGLQTLDTKLDQNLALFRAYEEAYVRQRDVSDSVLRSFVEDADRAHGELSRNTVSCLQAISKEMSADLSKILGDVGGRMEQFTERLEKMDRPIIDASVKIAASFDNMVRYNQERIGELLRAYDEQGRLTREHLDAIQLLRGDFEKAAEKQSAETIDQNVALQDMAKAMRLLHQTLGQPPFGRVPVRAVPDRAAGPRHALRMSDASSPAVGASPVPSRNRTSGSPPPPTGAWARIRGWFGSQRDRR